MTGVHASSMDLDGDAATAAAPAGPPPVVELRLLAGFELLLDAVPCILPPSAERLVAYLALHERPLARAHVSGVLWPDRDDESASACLRSTIWRANAGSGLRLVEAGRTRIALSSLVRVDTRDATTAAHVQLARGDPVAPIDPGTLVGDLLPGWYDDWVVVERERLRQLCLVAMEQMARALLDAGQAGLAIEAALSVVSAEPLRESAQRVLIEAHVAAGNRVEALRQFDRCSQALRDELGLTPGEALAAAAALAYGPAAVTQAAREGLESAVGHVVAR